MKNVADELAALREAVRRTLHLKLQMTQLVDLCEALALQENSKASHITALYSKCMQQAREIVRTESELQQADSELVYLKGECVRISQLDCIRAESIDRVRQEVDEALKERSDTEARCIALVDKLAQAERKIRELQAAMTTQTAKLELEQKTRQSLQQECDCYRSKVSEHEAAVLDLQCRIDELIKGEETRASQWTAKCEAAAVQAGEEGRQRRAAERGLDEARAFLARIPELETELACLRDQLRASDQERCALRARQEANADRISGLEQMADHSASVCRGLEASRGSAEAEAAALQRELVESRLQLEQMAAIKQMVAVLESQARASELEITHLRSELEARSATSARFNREDWSRPIEARVDALTARFKRTCAELQSFEQTNAVLQANLDAANTTIAELRMSVTTACQSSLQAVADLRSATSANAQLQSDLKDANARAEQLELELACSQNEIGRLMTEASNAADALMTEVGKSAELRSELDHLQSELEVHKSLYPRDWKLVLATAQKASHYEKELHAFRSACRCQCPPSTTSHCSAHAEAQIDCTGSPHLRSSPGNASMGSAVECAFDRQRSVLETSFEEASRQFSCAGLEAGTPSEMPERHVESQSQSQSQSHEVRQTRHSSGRNGDGQEDQTPQIVEIEIRRRIHAETELSHVVRQYGGTVQQLKQQLSALVASFDADSLQKTEELMVLRRAFMRT
jgi:chromosome segregation ATPase